MYTINNIQTSPLTIHLNRSVADPRFPVGGAPTSDVGAFWQKHMQKRKNWILFVGGAGGAPWIRQCQINPYKYYFYLENTFQKICRFVCL